MLNRIRTEPVLVTTLIGALLTVLVQAGLPISDGLANSITALVVAVLAIVARSKVTPANAAAGEEGESVVTVLLVVLLVLAILWFVGVHVNVG